MARARKRDRPEKQKKHEKNNAFRASDFDRESLSETQSFHFFVFFLGVFPASDFYRESLGETQNSAFFIDKGAESSEIWGWSGGMRGAAGEEKGGVWDPHF